MLSEAELLMMLINARSTKARTAIEIVTSMSVNP
jgi:hypothetical protein